jgi:hypothetical protein
MTYDSLQPMTTREDWDTPLHPRVVEAIRLAHEVLLSGRSVVTAGAVPSRKDLLAVAEWLLITHDITTGATGFEMSGFDMSDFNLSATVEPGEEYEDETTDAYDGTDQPMIYADHPRENLPPHGTKTTLPHSIPIEDGNYIVRPASEYDTVATQSND